MTDCLDFGNPEKPEIGRELAQAIEGIAEAAEELGIPVVSGNVSLYNETDGRAIRHAGRRLRRARPRHHASPIAVAPRRHEPCLLRGEGADLVRFVWQNAHRFSLAHDVSWRRAGDSAAPEAAAWSELPRRPNSESFKEDRGFLVAVAPGTELEWPDVVGLGTV